MEGRANITLPNFVKQQYDYIFHYDLDKRIIDWPLMSSPYPPFLISFVYVIFCLWIGPQYMLYRKPFRLKKILLVYNAFQVAFSTWIFTMGIRGGWFTGYSFSCQPLDKSNSPQAVMMVHMAWWYFISKFVDFFDSVAFVLRKKYDQLTFLHMGHHSGMPFACWYGIRFMPGGHVTFIALLNSLVHTVMYTYYFLAGLGPSVQKYLWWKKYLTIFQMVQFVLIVLHQAQLLFTDCDYPRFQCYWGLFFGTWIFLLFLEFYIENYQDRARAQKAKDKNLVDTISSFIPCHNLNGHMKSIKNGTANGKIPNGKVMIGNGHAMNGDVKGMNGNVTNGNGVMNNKNGKPDDQVAQNNMINRNGFRKSNDSNRKLN